MAEGDSGTSGLLDSVRRIGNSLLALIHTRVELFAVELQEEKLRAVSFLGWLTAALALTVAGILIAIGILGLFLWERAGYAGLIGLALATLGSAAGLLWILRRRILRGPDPFAATISEIAKDLECLRPPQ
jgi:uncharacterized membrane protein YqjE